MNKKIMLIMFTLLISFMCINVKAEETNTAWDNFGLNPDTNTDTPQSPQEWLDDSLDNLDNQDEIMDEVNNYFTGSDGKKGRYLGCVYESQYATMILKAAYYATGNVQIEHVDSGGSLDVQWKDSLETWIKDNKTCPKAATIYGDDAYFGSSSKTGKTYKKYVECEGEDCHWLTLDKIIATNTVSDISTYETERDKNANAEVEDFVQKYQKDRDYETTEVKIENGCGLFSPKMTEYIRTALFYVVLGGIVITIVMGLIDFIKAVTGIEDKGMSKAWQRFLKRIISLAVLIILPALVAFLLTALDLKGVNEGSIFCGIVEE